MNFTVAYKGRSGVSGGTGGMALSFAPNLRRDRVSFVGDLRDPLRFREAVSALHAVVVSDLKFKPKDRSAYQAYLKRVQEREKAIRRSPCRRPPRSLRAVEPEPMPPGWSRGSRRCARNTGRRACVTATTWRRTTRSCGGCSSRATRSSPSRRTCCSSSASARTSPATAA